MTSTPVTTLLSDVLSRSSRAAPDLRPYFHREAELRALAPEHVCYAAVRDAAAPVPMPARGETWHLDRVHFRGEDLPTGELNRSVGHWNPADQVEVFEVESGAVVIVVREPRPGAPVWLVRAAVGSTVSVPPGSWHLTYVPDGPATVTNVYSRRAEPPAGKYFTRPPVRCGLRRVDGIPAVFATEDVAAAGIEWVDAADFPGDRVDGPLWSVFRDETALVSMGLARVES